MSGVWAGGASFHDKTWCPQGHVRPVGAGPCPTCRTRVAAVASELLGRLDELAALKPEPLIGRAHGELELLPFAFGGR